MSSTVETKMVNFHMPEDAATRAALGAVTVRHSQLDYILRMTVKTISGLSLKDALDATEGDGSAYLRDQVKKLAKKRLGDGTPYNRLRALLTRCRQLTKKRNAYVHGVYGKYLDGDPMISTYEGWKHQPTVAELEQLAQEIFALTVELNKARFSGGFLAEALAAQL